MMATEMVNDIAKRALLDPIVDSLKFQYSDPNLTTQVKLALSEKALPSDIFYVKSEIKRLAKPCARLIDLRSLVSGVTFEAFEWEGMIHMLDKESAKLFVNLIKKYNGEYTFGVYEGVIKKFKENKAQIKKEQFASNVEIDTVSLSEVYGRDEERMNLGVKVSIYPLPQSLLKAEDESFSYILNSAISLIKKSSGLLGNTVDISQSGLQVRLPKELPCGQFLAVRFNGLEDDFVFKRKYIAYKVVKSTPSSGDDYLASLIQVDLKEHNEFQDFTKRLIYANKRRYKVNLDNTVKSVRSKLYEQFYLSRRHSIDLFIEQNGSIPYMLYSDPCLETLQWFSLNDRQYLSDLLTKDGVVKAANDEGVVYWAVLMKPSSGDASRPSFYSTVISSELSYKFAAYALRSNQGKVFKISVSEINNVNPFVTSSLPRSVHMQRGDSSVYRYAPQLNKSMRKLSHLVTLKEVTNDAMDIFDIHGFNASKKELASCSSYHMKDTLDYRTEVVRLESNEFRKEDRFSLVTDVSISFGDKVLNGRTLDVSTRGLAIKLDGVTDLDAKDFKMGREVRLTFLDFLKSESDFNLKDVIYKIVALKKGVLRLEAAANRGFVGIQFWNKYISENIERLKIIGSQESVVGLRRALRNIVAQCHTSVPAFFSIKDSKPCIRRIGLSSAHSDAPLWSSVNSDFTADTQLKPFLYHKAIIKRLVLDLPEIRKAKPFKNYFVVVKYDSFLGGQIEVKDVVFIPDRDAIESLQKEILSSGNDFRIFNVSLTKKTRLFDRYFKDEFSYLESYAPHKAAKLMFEIKTLTGILDFDDVTSFMRSYLDFRNAN